jgi:hypothetical protein
MSSRRIPRPPPVSAIVPAFGALILAVLLYWPAPGVRIATAQGGPTPTVTPTPGPTLSRTPAAVVRARRFELVDDRDRTQAVLGVEQGIAGLSVLSAAGVPRIVAGLAPDGRPMFSLHDAAGMSRIMISMGENVVIEFHHGDGLPGLALVLMEDGTAVLHLGEPMTASPGAVLIANPDGSAALMLGEPGRSAMILGTGESGSRGIGFLLYDWTGRPRICAAVDPQGRTIFRALEADDAGSCLEQP